MKKAFCFIVIFIIIFSLCSCHKNTIILENINFDTVNYNNSINDSTGICTDDDTFFYYFSGLMSNRILMYKDGKKETIILNNLAFSNEAVYDYIFIENFMYLSTYNDTTKEKSIYKYYPSTKTYEKIISSTNLLSWMGTKDFVVYLTNNLYIYDIKNKTEKLVVEGNINFCVVNNNVRYITTDGNRLHKIFEFDLTTNMSQKLGEFLLKYESDLLTYNFTSDSIVVCDHETARNSITIWSTNNKTYEYTLPISVQEIIAGEDFAYALCYESEDYSTSAKENINNGVYKINLSNGDYEKIYDYANDDIDIYVHSDSLIYIIRFNFHFLRGFYNTVYKYDDTSKEITELFRY